MREKWEEGEKWGGRGGRGRHHKSINAKCLSHDFQPIRFLEWDHMTVLHTNEEGVSIVLLEHPADPGGMLNCKLEHH